MRYFLVICLAVSTTFVTQKAHACSGSRDAWIQLKHILPKGDNVPLNAKIFLFFNTGGDYGTKEVIKKAKTIQLQTSEGVAHPISITSTLWGTQLFVRVAPTGLLAPRSTYSISSQVPKVGGCGTNPTTCPDGTLNEIGKFTTSTTQDTTPPTFQGVTSVKQHYYESENSCSGGKPVGHGLVNLHWEATKRNEPGNNYFYQIYQLDDLTKPIFSFMPTFLPDLTDTSLLQVGFLCFGHQEFYDSHPFSGIAKGNQPYVIRAVDVAENVDSNVSTFTWKPDCRRLSEREPPEQEPQQNETIPDGPMAQKKQTQTTQGCSMLADQMKRSHLAWMLFICCALFCWRNKN